MTPETRRHLVLDAIDRIHFADSTYRRVEQDPRASAAERGFAKDRLRMVTEEFQWQWQNVEELLRPAAAEEQAS